MGRSVWWYDSRFGCARSRAHFPERPLLCSMHDRCSLRMQRSGPCTLTPSVTGRCLVWTYSERPQRSRATSGAPHARAQGAGRLHRLWWWPGVALARWLTWHDPGRTWQKPDPSSTQTCNRRVRRATPYPLGHGARLVEVRPALCRPRATRSRNGLGPRLQKKTPQEPQSGHGVGRFLSSMALLHWSAPCCSFVIVSAVPAASETGPRCLCACLLFQQRQ